MTGVLRPSSLGNFACRLRKEEAASASVFCEESCTRKPSDEPLPDSAPDRGEGAAADRVLDDGALLGSLFGSFACGSSESGPPEALAAVAGGLPGLPLASP